MPANFWKNLTYPRKKSLGYKHRSLLDFSTILSFCLAVSDKSGIMATLNDGRDIPDEIIEISYQMINKYKISLVNFHQMTL